jgi:uncharacterized membrane protein
MTAQTCYMDAVLTPHSAMGERGQAIVIGLVALACFALGIAFLSMGALPVLGFLGLDVVLIWIAFRASRAGLRQVTYVRVDADTLNVRHVDGRGRTREVALPSAFARVELFGQDPERAQVRVSAAGKVYEIARFLPPGERASFAAALDAALTAARNERYRE